MSMCMSMKIKGQLLEISAPATVGCRDQAHVARALYSQNHPALPCVHSLVHFLTKQNKAKTKTSPLFIPI